LAIIAGEAGVMDTDILIGEVRLAEGALEVHKKAFSLRGFWVFFGGYGPRATGVDDGFGFPTYWDGRVLDRRTGWVGRS